MLGAWGDIRCCYGKERWIVGTNSKNRWRADECEEKIVRLVTENTETTEKKVIF